MCKNNSWADFVLDVYLHTKETTCPARILIMQQIQQTGLIHGRPEIPPVLSRERTAAELMYAIILCARMMFSVLVAANNVKIFHLPLFYLLEERLSLLGKRRAAVIVRVRLLAGAYHGRRANQHLEYSIRFFQGTDQPFELLPAPYRCGSDLRVAKFAALYEPDLQALAPAYRTIGPIGNGILFAKDNRPGLVIATRPIVAAIVVVIHLPVTGIFSEKFPLNRQRTAAGHFWEPLLPGRHSKLYRRSG